MIEDVPMLSSSLLSDDVLLLVLSDRRRETGLAAAEAFGGDPGELCIDEFISSILDRSVVVNCFRCRYSEMES